VQWNRLGPDLVVFTLAIGLAGSTLIFAVGLLYEVIDHMSITEVPPNSSQILTLIFGGTIGIVGTYVGYRQSHPDENP